MGAKRIPKKSELKADILGYLSTRYRITQAGAVKLIGHYWNVNRSFHCGRVLHQLTRGLHPTLRRLPDGSYAKRLKKETRR